MLQGWEGTAARWRRAEAALSGVARRPGSDSVGELMIPMEKQVSSVLKLLHGSEGAGRRRVIPLTKRGQRTIAERGAGGP